LILMASIHPKPFLISLLVRALLHSGAAATFFTIYSKNSFQIQNIGQSSQSLIVNMNQIATTFIKLYMLTQLIKALLCFTHFFLSVRSTNLKYIYKGFFCFSITTLVLDVSLVSYFTTSLLQAINTFKG